MKGLLAVALAAASIPYAPAQAEPLAAGRFCGSFSSGRQTGGESGTIDSGPAIATALPDTRAVSVTVVCDIQVGGTGSYADPDVVHEVATGETVAIIQPPRSYDITYPPGSVTWLCTTWVVTDADGNVTTYYRNNVEDVMTTDPSATCRGPL